MHTRNIEIVLDNMDSNPHCLHGPCIIFQKNTGKRNKYFGCSACRNQKECDFYLPVNNKDSNIDITNFWRKQQKDAVTLINKSQSYKKYCKILKLFKDHLIAKTKVKQNIFNVNNNVETVLADTKLKAGFCYTCNCLFVTKEKEKHINCQTIFNLTYHQLTHPTETIIPKTDNETHAQYFFSKNTVKDILLLLRQLNVTKILCIGVPRVHEFVLNHCKHIQSLLLDLDKNYFNFYSKHQFIWFNMFNNYIFDPDQNQILHTFLRGTELIILLDPPFGGRVEPLARTLQMLSKTYREINNIKGNALLKTIWFFPYFMEPYILESLPKFRMFDYKVNYENHSSFTSAGNKKRKFGSPVRIFTNIPLSRFDLTNISGYKFCKICQYWVSNENRHCRECKTCTSKDGRTYIHCYKCSRCVKPSFKHCEICNRCCLQNHVCGEFKPDQNCYHCHQPGHKKNECLLLKKTKRKKKAKEESPKKKQKLQKSG